MCKSHYKVCMCMYLVCKRRYKTVASLKAHTTQYHGRDMSASSSPVPLPIISTIPIPQLPSLPPSAAGGTAAATGVGTVGTIPIVTVTVPAPIPPIPDEKVPVFLRPPPNLQVREHYY